MDNDSNKEALAGQMEGVPTSGLPDPDDGPTRISNSGQRILAILVAVIAMGAALGAIYWYSEKKSEIAKHEKVKIAFKEAHSKAYTSFYQTAQVNISSMKNNEDFELKMKAILSDDPVRYAKHIKEKCLPLIDEGIEKYREIEAPSAYGTQFEHVTNTASLMRNAWSEFANEALRFESFFDGKKSLDKAANAWLGAQRSKNPKYQTGALKYFRLLGCVLNEQKVEEIESSEINYTIQNSCVSNKPEWFRRVAYECIPGLLKNPGEPSPEYAAALQMAKKSARGDHASKFGITDCLDATQSQTESAMIEPLAKSWRDYIVAYNEALAKLDQTVKELR